MEKIDDGDHFISDVELINRNDRDDGCRESGNVECALSNENVRDDVESLIQREPNQSIRIESVMKRSGKKFQKFMKVFKQSRQYLRRKV